MGVEGVPERAQAEGMEELSALAKQAVEKMGKEDTQLAIDRAVLNRLVKENADATKLTQVERSALQRIAMLANTEDLSPPQKEYLSRVDLDSHTAGNA